MKIESVKKNYIYNSIIQVFGLLLPLITIPYVSRVLGADNVGEYSFALSIACFFSLLADFGTSIFGQREIAFTRKDIEGKSQIFWNNVTLRLILSVVMFLSYIPYVAITSRNRVIALICAIKIIDMPFNINWYFIGMEQFRKIVFENFVIRLVTLACTFLFVKNETDLWKYVLIVMLDNFAADAFLWLFLKNQIVLVKRVHPFKHIKDSFLLFIPSIAGQVYLVLDKSMIGWITGSNYANGCYEQSERIVRVALTIITSLAAVVMPRVSNLFKNNSIEESKEYIYKSYRTTFLLALPMMFGMIAVSSVFVPLFLGQGFDESVVLIQIFSALLVFVGLANITGLSYLISTEQQNIYSISVSLAAFVNLCMNMMLIRKYGAIGAAVASISAEFIGCSFQIGYCVIKKQLKLGRIFDSVWKYLLSSIIMCVVILFIKRFVAHGALDLVLLIFLGILMYCSMLIALKDSFFTNQVKTTFCRFREKVLKKS